MAELPAAAHEIAWALGRRPPWRPLLVPPHTFTCFFCAVGEAFEHTPACLWRQAAQYVRDVQAAAGPAAVDED